MIESERRDRETEVRVSGSGTLGDGRQSTASSRQSEYNDQSVVVGGSWRSVDVVMAHSTSSMKVRIGMRMGMGM